MIFAELLDRRGRVLQRARVASGSLPFTLGRSYENDWILDDPYVSPHHARIEADGDGTLVLRDLGSENGVLALSPPRRVEDFPIRPETAVQLGRSTIRFRSADHPVPSALRVPAESRIRRWLANHWSTGLCGLLALWMVGILQAVRDAPAEVEVLPVVGQLVAITLLFGLWAGLWALITRMLSPRSRFSAHLAVSCGGFVCAAGIERLAQYALFLLGASRALTGLHIALEGIVIFATIVVQLYIAGVLRPLARLALAGALAATFAFLSRFEEIAFSEEDDSGLLPYATALERVDPSWLSTEPPDAFFAAVRSLGPELEGVLRDIEAREAER